MASQIHKNEQNILFFTVDKLGYSECNSLRIVFYNLLTYHLIAPFCLIKLNYKQQTTNRYRKYPLDHVAVCCNRHTFYFNKRFTTIGSYCSKIPFIFLWAIIVASIWTQNIFDIIMHRVYNTTNGRCTSRII